MGLTNQVHVGRKSVAPRQHTLGYLGIYQLTYLTLLTKGLIPLHLLLRSYPNGTHDKHHHPQHYPLGTLTTPHQLIIIQYCYSMQILCFLLLVLAAASSTVVCPFGQIYSVSLSQCVSCLYTCDQCSANNYFSCIICASGRGYQGMPTGGMCYCSDDEDQDQSGLCVPPAKSKGYRATITGLIVIVLLVSMFSAVVKTNRFFLLRLFQDMQEVSLVLLVNLYYPNQLDQFLSMLYKFNFTSIAKVCEAMATSTFSFNPLQILGAKDMTLSGKYLLLLKSSNFFSNSFNLIFLWAIVVGLMFLLLFLKRKFVQKYGTDGRFYIVKGIFNVLYLGLALNVFYFSLIELNLNIAIQFSNGPFQSNFSRFGVAMAVIMLIAEAVALFFMFKYFRQQMIVRPQYRNPHLDTMWRDLSESEGLLSKYFWFCSCVKHIILPVVVVTMYRNPQNQLLGLAIFQGLWTFFCVAVAPYSRKYMRLNLYVNETLKFLIYVALINFQQQYVQFQSVIQIIYIIYVLILLIPLSSLLFLAGHLLVEYQVYWYSIKRMAHSDLDMGRGVFIDGKLYVYDDQASQIPVAPASLPNESINNLSFDNNLKYLTDETFQ